MTNASIIIAVAAADDGATAVIVAVTAPHEAAILVPVAADDPPVLVSISASELGPPDIIIAVSVPPDVAPIVIAIAISQHDPALVAVAAAANPLLVPLAPFGAGAPRFAPAAAIFRTLLPLGAHHGEAPLAAAAALRTLAPLNPLPTLGPGRPGALAALRPGCASLAAAAFDLVATILAPALVATLGPRRGSDGQRRNASR